MFQILQRSYSQYWIMMILGATLACIIYWITTIHQRAGLSEYLSSWIPVVIRGRRISTSKTPPRSLSPERKVPNNTPSAVDYRDILPPSIRDSLARIALCLPPAQSAKLRHGPSNSAEIKKGLIPLAADYRECGPSTYTPTGVSIEEIQALGDFPDYAVLSGVPRPQAYKGFNVEMALPRPYRPFRWAYHQTMCMSYRPRLELCSD